MIFDDNFLLTGRALVRRGACISERGRRTGAGAKSVINQVGNNRKEGEREERESISARCNTLQPRFWQQAQRSFYLRLMIYRVVRTRWRGKAGRGPVRKGEVSRYLDRRSVHVPARYKHFAESTLMEYPNNS